MQDRVAEVLAQRAALDNGGAGGVILSILLHILIAGAAIYAALHAKPPKMVSTLNIRFAKMPAAAAPAIESKPAEAPKAVPKIEPPKPQPVKPVETKKPVEKGTVPFSPFGKSTKKGSETPESRIPNPESRPATAAPGVSAQLEGGDFPYTIYIERMKTNIGAHWFRPQATGEAVTMVYFVIERDGTIRDVRTETPSGNSAVDRAALRAVMEANPLPPLPFGYAGTYLGVHLTFR